MWNIKIEKRIFAISLRLDYIQSNACVVKQFAVLHTCF